MKRILLVLCLLCSMTALMAQSIRDEINADIRKSGGLYMAYPGPQKAQTPAPKGFRPFYVSHLGRHGSRWLADGVCYEETVKMLASADSAGKLTSLGKDVLSRLRVIAADAKGHEGELTPLGVRQHKEIAGRMVASFPEAFAKGAEVTANSTQSTRVMISMFSFCDRLKESFPGLRIDVNSSVRDEAFVANRSDESRNFFPDDVWNASYLPFRAAHVHPERMMGTLFNDPEYVKSLDAELLYEYLFEVASIVQNCPVDVSLYDIFTVDELYDFWQVRNYEYYASKGSNPAGGDVLLRAALPMLEHFLDKADEYVSSGAHGATLRFSHDSYLVPLSVCMQLDGCRGRETDPDRYHAAFVTYKISPMGGNVQWVFYRNRQGEVIVKFMLNENEVGIPAATDIYPYYRWEDVKAFYGSQYGLAKYLDDDAHRAAAGLLMPYPGVEGVTYSPVPKGYRPFYISHFGRHGSRWHTRANMYTYPVNVLTEAAGAGVLTDLGRDVLRRVSIIAEDARSRTGELTQQGFRQHEEIAGRMYSNYREVFKGGGRVTAHSTRVPRVMLSMQSFCSTLKGLNPQLDITMETGSALKGHLSKLSKEGSKYAKNAVWKPVLDDFEAEMYKPERLMSTLFADSAYVQSKVNSHKLMDALYELAGIVTDSDLDIRLYDIFEQQELTDIWKVKNYSYYMQKGPNVSAGDSVLASASEIVRDFITKADKAVAGSADADVATLRFSHDSYLTPLTTTMRLGGCRERTDDPMEAAEIWSTSKVSPMAANIQWVLYRNRKGDVIVKILHNEREVDIPVETDIYPYYHWADVRRYYDEVLGLGLDR